MTVMEAYVLFKEEYGAVIGKSKFAQLRPENVLHMADIPANVCLCSIHANINYLLSSLKSSLHGTFPGDHRELADQCARM